MVMCSTVVSVNVFKVFILMAIMKGSWCFLLYVSDVCLVPLQGNQPVTGYKYFFQNSWEKKFSHRYFKGRNQSNQVSWSRTKLFEKWKEKMVRNFWCVPVNYFDQYRMNFEISGIQNHLICEENSYLIFLIRGPIRWVYFFL